VSNNGVGVVVAGGDEVLGEKFATSGAEDLFVQHGGGLGAGGQMSLGYGEARDHACEAGHRQHVGGDGRRGELDSLPLLADAQRTRASADVAVDEHIQLRLSRVSQFGAEGRHVVVHLAEGERQAPGAVRGGHANSIADGAEAVDDSDQGLVVSSAT